MNIKSKPLKLYMLGVILLLAIGVWGDTEIEAPTRAADIIKDLDDISQKQLDYFLKISGAVETINRKNFSKPYDNESKEKISRLLAKASEIEPDKCHQKYLVALSYAVLSDTFYSLAPEWFHLKENKMEIVFFPNETHLMQELWLRLLLDSFTVDWEHLHFQDQSPFITHMTSNKIFDTFIYLNDFEETQRFEEYRLIFDKMDDHVPYQSKEKVVPYKSAAPAIKIVHLLYPSLPGRVSFVYPNREVFYYSSRFKVVIFKNLIDAYVECILKPLSEKVLSEHQVKSIEIDSESYLSNLVMHKISHHIGPMFKIQPKFFQLEEPEANLPGGPKGKSDPGVRKAEHRKIWSQQQLKALAKRKEEMELQALSNTMGDAFPVVEEIKSGFISMHNTSVLIEEGLLPREKEIDIYATYVVSLVDKIRKDPRAPLVRAYAYQLILLLQKGAISFNINTKKISIHEVRFPLAVEEMTSVVLRNYNNPFALLRGGITPELQAILSNLEEIPKDVNININVEQTNVKEK